MSSIRRSNVHPDSRAAKTLVVSVLTLRYASFLALLVVAGVGFGWRVPAAVALVIGAIVGRLHLDRRWPKGLHPNKPIVALDVIVSGIVGAALAGLLFGGAAPLFGWAIGVVTAVSSVPLSSKQASGARVPLTLQGSPSTAKGLNVFGFLLPVIVLAVCALLLLSR